MGANSTDALQAFLKEYLKGCYVLGNRIIPPDEVPGYVTPANPTAGGHRLPTAPPVGCVDPDAPGCDWKRGQ